MALVEIKKEIESAILVGVRLRNVSQLSFEESIQELAKLALTAEAKVLGQIVQNRPTPDSRYYIGKGKLEELQESLRQTGASLVIFDEQLSPAQVKNLEDKLETKVIDRGNLILDIFARHARSREARIQVEMAQLQYLLPRLTRMWSHFSRHAGGIGTKGPGETQLESDRRAVGKKIGVLKKRLSKIKKQRETQRKQRQKVFKIALVGYTNAGKSTIFNYLTKSGVWTDDRLFCTLDAVSRYLPLDHERQIVISDTVGFIRKLPHQLVASFTSTLDEVRYADLLLHVVDISHSNSVEQYQRTNQVLEELGAGNIDQFLICNKCDLLGEDSFSHLDPDFDPRKSFHISALTGSGMDKMLNSVQEFVENRQ